MYIPDLFGAYMAGREYAIDRNWKDLANYEAIEKARNYNDLLALNVLGTRADFGGNRAMFQNQVDESGRNNETKELLQAGVAAKADLFSQQAQALRKAELSNLLGYARGLDAAAKHRNAASKYGGDLGLRIINYNTPYLDQTAADAAYANRTAYGTASNMALANNINSNTAIKNAEINKAFKQQQYADRAEDAFKSKAINDLKINAVLEALNPQQPVQQAMPQPVQQAMPQPVQQPVQQAMPQPVQQAQPVQRGLGVLPIVSEYGYVPQLTQQPLVLSSPQQAQSQEASVYDLLKAYGY